MAGLEELKSEAPFQSSRMLTLPSREVSIPACLQLLTPHMGAHRGIPGVLEHSESPHQQENTEIKD